MKNNMNLSLNNSSIDPIERLINALNDFFDAFQQSKKTFSENLKFCRELRTNRKKFELEVGKTLKQFHCLPENQQVEIELVFKKALRRLELMVPKVKDGIDNDQLFFLFSYLLKRDVTKTLLFFRKSQAKMALQLYSDPTDKILSNPELQQTLINQWGDLAKEEY